MGAGLLAPGAVIFALRAALEVAGRDPSAVPGLGPLTGLGGALSLAGLVFVVWALGAAAVAGAACVLAGHFWLAPLDLGAGLVYLGTGLLVARVAPTAAAAGSVALLGTLTREATVAGHGLVAVGAAWLAVELIQVCRADMHRR